MKSEDELIFDLNSVIYGERIVEHRGVSYLFREPSGFLLHQAEMKRPKFFKDCIEDGFLSEEEEKEQLKIRGMWSKEDAQTMETLIADYKKINSQSSELTFRSNTKKQANLYLEAIEKEIHALELKRKSFYFQTAEYQSDMRTKQWLLQKTLFDLDGRLVWETEDDLNDHTDLKMIGDLTVLCFFDGALSESKIRKIARSEPFRSSWRVATKTGDSLFGKNISDYTQSQKDLCYWSLIYDSVFESVDCPDQSVIDDDKALNAWFESQAEERKSKSSNKGQISKNPKINNASEVFVFAETQEDAKAVYNLNDGNARSKIASRRKEIESKGQVKEAELSDVKRDLKIQMNQLSFQKPR
jgi:hypothetical protein